MTVLSEENALGESSSAPPRKRICLSLSVRGKQLRDHHKELTNAKRQLSTNLTGTERVQLKEDYQDCNFSPVPSQRFYSQGFRNKPRAAGINYLTNPLAPGAMLNGYLAGDGHNKSSTDESPGSETGLTSSPIATLCNLGNTCFLNSVLYTLRFAPAFLHNLHHLVADLAELSSKNQQIKIKSASLGRSVASGGGSSKSWSSKDLLSMAGDPLCKSRIQVATERLHELYENLRLSESKDQSEPLQPDSFLRALREVNPIFEGNQQHDAHELLVCLLDNIRETCRLLAAQTQAQLSDAASSLLDADATAKASWGVRKSWKMKKTGLKGSSVPRTGRMAEDEKAPLLNGTAQLLTGIAENDLAADGVRQTAGHNFVAADFEGVSVLRTTCLECEHETERKEAFCDICVPIAPLSADAPPVSEVYRAAVVTSEFLRDTNKYWCEQCLRYNEARRSVSYEKLPRLLVLQLKRFSSTFGSMVCVSKVNDYMPTPLTLACFCERCCPLKEEDRPHHYKLYGVIMHLGATIASGHYVAYVKASENLREYQHCDRERRTPGDKLGLGFFKFLRPKSSPGDAMTRPHLCRSAECCGVRLSLQHNDMEADAAVPEPSWLECDDETVRPLSRSQLEEVLAPREPKGSAQTPYLLFYARCP